MAVTKEQALTADRFHENATCSATNQWTWRRNGKTQTWKTRSEDFRVPVKFGLYNYAAITHLNADEFHTEVECPHLHQIAKQNPGSIPGTIG